MFSKALLVSGLAALSAAQSAVLTFTHVPNPITDGQAQAITFSTNDTTSPVTILLRKGQSGDLQTVSTLTTSATGGQFIWTPATSLADGTDYALEITQGNQLNYFGPFEVQGSVASAVSSASSASATASPSSYISTTVSANGTASTTVPIAPGTAAPGTVGTASAGTGTALPRNTTMSMATLTASGSASSTAGSPSTNSATGTAGAGSGSSGSSSSASPSASSTTNGASALEMGTTVSLLVGVVAAVFFLQ